MNTDLVLNNKYQQLIFLLFAFTALVDSFNGFLVHNYSLPVTIGQVYRIIVILLMIGFAVKYQKKYNASIGIWVLYYLIFIQFIFFYYHQSASGLFTDLMEVMRVFLIIVIIEALRALYNYGKINLNTIEKVFKVSIILFPLCIVIPWVFGVGYSMYVLDVGYSAFFYAANDLNVVLLMMLIFALDLMFKGIENKQRFLLYAISVLLIITSLLLLGSKASMFFGVLIVIFYLLKGVNSSKTIGNKFKLISIMGLSLGIVYASIQLFFLDDLLAAFDRHFFFFQQDAVENNSFSTFILTGRDGFLSAAITAFNNSDFDVLRFLFGVGYYSHLLETGYFLNRGPTPIEMDMFDVFFSYGIIGLVLIYGYLISIFIKVSRRKKIREDYSRYYFGFIIVMMYSFLGGHVIFSALSGSYFALICSGLLIVNNEHLRK
ncbi:O-antigen ligase family protein [Shouchella miscanthi]|uniref:O-antigen ligase family protein n=1 Tax=Shouchella miscanthi TaxID=2598861 RepID=UPI001643750E|nr:O-antigen ligase family protein [Shouchella miscanthi]